MLAGVPLAGAGACERASSICTTGGSVTAHINWTYIGTFRSAVPMIDSEIDRLLDSLSWAGAAMAVDRDRLAFEVIMTIRSQSSERRAIACGDESLASHALNIGIAGRVSSSQAMSTDLHDRLLSEGGHP
jgi:hypothetical protein